MRVTERLTLPAASNDAEFADASAVVCLTIAETASRITRCIDMGLLAGLDDVDWVKLSHASKFGTS
jgi:hypothetical protein